MPDKIYDLHCHSNESDGILSPEALVSRAKAQDVSVLALTDHDSINGLAKARTQAKAEGLELITGIEFSTQWGGHSIHIVALAFDETHAGIQELIRHQEESRVDRARQIGERLASRGLPSDLYERASAIANGATIGRPHFAEALIQSGSVSSAAQAFKKYLGAGKVGDVKMMWPGFGDIIPIIADAGGVAVMAHPLKYKATRTKILRILADFIDCGGRGMEVLSGLQKPTDTRDLARIANQLGLLASTGSDFHAPGQHWSELGAQGRLPDNVVPVWQHWQ